MKKLLRNILCPVILLANAPQAPGQELKPDKVPDPVRGAFGKLHANTYVYEWEWKKKEKLYKAAFMEKGMKCAAYFMPSGNWTRTSCKLKKEQLPLAVSEQIRQTPYAGWKTDDLRLYRSPLNESIYGVELEKGKEEIILYFRPDGTPVPDLDPRAGKPD